VRALDADRGAAAAAAAAVPHRLRQRLSVWCAASMLFAFAVSGALVLALLHGNEALSLHDHVRLLAETNGDVARLVLVVIAAVAVCRVGGRAVATWALTPLTEITHQLAALRTAPLASRVVEAGAADDLHELVRAINARLDCAQAAVQHERGIVDDLAHELRTSLTAQILAAEMALSCPATARAMPAQVQEVVCNMLDEARHMEQLISGLLTLARLRTHRETVQLRRVDVLDVAASCVHTLQVLAEEKAQSLELIGHGRPMAHAEPTMLRQSLMSIVHNAIDHCHRGAVIRVRINAGAAGGSGVEVCIEDDGPGIPVAQQARIFERFVRGEGGCRTGRGLGLGLAIAKAMTEAQGGSIRVDSALGQGTRFLLAFRTAANARRPSPRLSKHVHPSVPRAASTQAKSL
jgi:two-component system, OmpR family, sensor kinase